MKYSVFSSAIFTLQIVSWQADFSNSFLLISVIESGMHFLIGCTLEARASAGRFCECISVTVEKGLLSKSP